MSNEGCLVLGQRHPEYDAAVQDYVRRLVDLHPLVKNHFYAPAMGGSFSIKKVLLVIAPDFDYGELEEVQEGTAAQLAYLQLAFDPLPEERRRQLRDGLVRYCAQDTRAMVEVAHFVEERTRPTRPH